MTQKPPPRRLGHYFDLPPRWEWIAWLALALGGSGIAIAVLWIREHDVLATVCAPLAVLVGTVAFLCWLSHLGFKAAEPRPEDSSVPPTDDNSHTQRS